MLPDFKQLTATYSPKELADRLKAIVDALNKSPMPDGMVFGKPAAELDPRFKTLLADVQKRADHKGIHGFRHDMALHGKDFAEEVMLFAVEQAVLLARLNPSADGRLRTLMGGDPADPDSAPMLLRAENEAAKSAVGASGKAARALLEKILSSDPPPPPKGQPSAHDLMFFSATTYKYLDKALWHTMRARKIKRLIDAYFASRKDEKDATKLKPLANCSEAATLAFLLQTYFHHFHKAKVYGSPMTPLAEFVTHYVSEWMAAWNGTGDADPKALRNLSEVYKSILSSRNTHKDWDCVKKGGTCYGPHDDPKKPGKPLKEMSYTDGTAKFTPVVASQPWAKELQDWGAATKIKMDKGLSAAGETISSFFKAAQISVGVFYEETLKPLVEDESIFAEPDARDKQSSARDAESLDEIVRDTKLQFERFAFWVMSEAPKEFKWKSDVTFIKRNMRRMVAAEHDDERHSVQPPWTKIFKDKPDEARFARMMYDVYGLVEAKDLSKNVSNAWKKFWAPKKKGELAVTLFFVTGGIVASVFTAGLPVIALIGIAAAKKIMTKASLKKVKQWNSSKNKAALQGKDVDPNTQLTLSATEARESAASLARHFVSSFKNYQRMLDKRAEMDALQEKGKQEDKKKSDIAVAAQRQRFYFEGCNAAISYCYAAHAFEHHFAKVVAKLTHLTAMTQSMLSTFEEGDAFFASPRFKDARAEIKTLVMNNAQWHSEHCDGRAKGKARIGASRGAKVYVSENLPSPICYALNAESTRVANSAGSNVAAMAPQRGLFYMDYTQAKNRAYPPFDMFEHWVNKRDALLASLKADLKKVMADEKAKMAPEVSKELKEAVLAETPEAEQGNA